MKREGFWTKNSSDCLWGSFANIIFCFFFFFSLFPPPPFLHSSSSTTSTFVSSLSSTTSSSQPPQSSTLQIIGLLLNHLATKRLLKTTPTNCTLDCVFVPKLSIADFLCLNQTLDLCAWINRRLCVLESIADFLCLNQLYNIQHIYNEST